MSQEADIYAPMPDRAGIYVPGEPLAARTIEMIPKKRITAGTDITLLARFPDAAGDAIDRTAVTGVVAEVFDLSADEPDETTHSIALVVSSVLTTSYTTGDVRWGPDTEGFNFEYTFTEPDMIKAGRRFLIVVTVERDTTDGGDMVQKFQVDGV